MTNPICNVAVVAPSSAFDAEMLEVSIALLNSWGVKAHKAPNLYAREPFTAGTVAQRLADLEGHSLVASMPFGRQEVGMAALSFSIRCPSLISL